MVPLAFVRRKQEILNLSEKVMFKGRFVLCFLYIVLTRMTVQLYDAVNMDFGPFVIQVYACMLQLEFHTLFALNSLWCVYSDCLKIGDGFQIWSDLTHGFIRYPGCLSRMI